jgi:nitroreductase
MLHFAHQGDACDWPAEHRDGLDLDFLVLASRVEGVSPGVYWYRTPNQDLVLSHPGLNAHEMVELFVQEEFASAPLLIWTAGDLAAACARHGAFGHRQLLLRAGTASNRVWMAALAMGLSGCLIAGIVPGAARDSLGLDGYRHASLMAVSLGFAKDDSISAQLSRGPFSSIVLPPE